MIVKILSLIIHSKLTFLKSSELHRLIKLKGWVHIRTSGSHYIYEKNGVNIVVPFHGSKEVPKGTERAIKKQAGL
jgi:mRNA interferase HicA